MKTVYIPTGTEVSHMNLATGHLVVDGSLTITGTLKAKTIGGRGFVEAGTVSADGIRVDDLKAVSVTCRRLYAKRVEASQIFASEGIDVSCFLGADRVVTPRLAMALSDIDEVTGLSGADRKRLILCGGDELRGRKSRYHLDGGLCALYPAGAIQAIAQAATAHKLYHTTYYNHLAAWVRRCESAEEVSAITYGAELPEDLAEHMAAILEAAGGGVDAV